MSYVMGRDQGAKLYTKDWGDGRPVIFLHGWPLSADVWDSQALAVAEAGYRAIAYDRRGFGRSSQPWDGYDYDSLADDLAALIEQTGARDITLVAHSMGGGEVARYMSRHAGKHVSQCVLVSSVLPGMLKSSANPQGVESSVFEAMCQGLRADRALFFSGFFRKFFGVGLLSQPVSEELLAWVQGIAMQASLRATLECVDAFGRTDFRPDLPALKTPTLIIHGTEDQTVPLQISARQAVLSLPQAMLIEYEGSPHGLFATDAQRLSTDLLDFLRR